MHSIEPNLAAKQDIIQLHATTSLLMSRFINGQHCPKLAHVIVQQLQRLLSHPALESAPINREMYRDLLEHWQSVTTELLEQRDARRQSFIYH
jgi:hypothetical protein